MKMESFSLASPADGLVLHGLLALPQGEPRAVVQLCHGMCEHKERYQPFMEYLAQQGFACCIHDHRGHGESLRSPGDLGYFYKNGGPALVEDIHGVNAMLHGRFPGKKVFLFGHSMGSLAVRAYAKQYDDTIDALVVCGSPSRPAGAGAGGVLVRVLQCFKGGHSRSRLADALFSGAFDRPFKAEGREHAWICSDTAVVEAYNADPLCTYTFTLNGYLALLYLVNTAYSPRGWQVKNPGLPVLFVSGSEDACRLSHRQFLQAVESMRSAGYRRVSWRIYEGMRHEILNETGRETVYREVAEFFGARLEGESEA